jgi:hypothetical protein
MEKLNFTYEFEDIVASLPIECLLAMHKMLATAYASEDWDSIKRAMKSIEEEVRKGFGH